MTDIPRAAKPTQGAGADFEFADGELSDDDPEVVAGMERLAVLRMTEEDIRDL
jgi:hypothetical protein